MPPYVGAPGLIRESWTRVQLKNGWPVPPECVARHCASSAFLTGNDLRIEIAVTHRKQTEGPNSNR